MSVSRIVFGITLVAALSVCVRANAAAAKGGGGGGAQSKAGLSESVKKWADMTDEKATAAHRPILLYIYDTDEKRNVTATLIEGPKFLGDSDVKAKESSFLCIKDKMGEGNGYPQDWVQQANGGAVLLVLSADMKVVQSFSKANKDQITAANLTAAMDAAVKASGNVPPAPKQPDNGNKAANKNNNKQPAKKNG